MFNWRKKKDEIFTWLAGSKDPDEIYTSVRENLKIDDQTAREMTPAIQQSQNPIDINKMSVAGEAISYAKNLEDKHKETLAGIASNYQPEDLVGMSSANSFSDIYRTGGITGLLSNDSFQKTFNKLPDDLRDDALKGAIESDSPEFIANLTAGADRFSSKDDEVTTEKNKAYFKAVLEGRGLEEGDYKKIAKAQKKQDREKELMSGADMSDTEKAYYKTVAEVSTDEKEKENAKKLYEKSLQEGLQPNEKFTKFMDKMFTSNKPGEYKGTQEEWVAEVKKAEPALKDWMIGGAKLAPYLANQLHDLTLQGVISNHLIKPIQKKLGMNVVSLGDVVSPKTKGEAQVMKTGDIISSVPMGVVGKAGKITKIAKLTKAPLVIKEAKKFGIKLTEEVAEKIAKETDVKKATKIIDEFIKPDNVKKAFKKEAQTVRKALLNESKKLEVKIKNAKNPEEFAKLNKELQRVDDTVKDIDTGKFNQEDLLTAREELKLKGVDTGVDVADTGKVGKTLNESIQDAPDNLPVATKRKVTKARVRVEQRVRKINHKWENKLNKLRQQVKSKSITKKAFRNSVRQLVKEMPSKERNKLLSTKGFSEMSTGKQLNKMIDSVNAYKGRVMEKAKTIASEAKDIRKSQEAIKDFNPTLDAPTVPKRDLGKVDLMRTTGKTTKKYEELVAKAKKTGKAKDAKKAEKYLEKNMVMKEGEYAVGEEAKSIDALNLSVGKTLEAQKKLKIKDKDWDRVLGYRETKDASFLDKFKKGFRGNKKVEKIIEVDKQVTKVMDDTGKKLVKMGILDKQADADTYFRAYLRRLDGGIVSDKKLMQIQAAMGESWGKLSRATQRISKGNVSDSRKYKFFKERDAVLKKYGVKTDTNMIRALANYAEQTQNVIKKEAVNLALRRVAKNKQGFFREAYDPQEIKAFRNALKDQLKKKIAQVVSARKGNREFTKKLIAKVDRLENLLPKEMSKMNEAKAKKAEEEALDTMMSMIKSELKGYAKGDHYSEVIDKLRKSAKKHMSDYYKKLIDNVPEDAVHLGEVDASLNGIYAIGKNGVKQRDFLEDFFTPLKSNDIVGTFDYIAQVLKFSQLAGDVFAFRNFATIRMAEYPLHRGGIVRGIGQFAWDTMGLTARKVAKKGWREDWVAHTVTGRDAMGDIPALQEWEGTLGKEYSALQKLAMKGAKLPIVKQYIALLDNVEKYLYHVVGDNLKVDVAHDMLEHSQKMIKNGKITELEAKETIGKVIDGMAYVTDMQKFQARHPGWKKSVQRLLRIFTIAPNLIITTGRNLKGNMLAFKPGPQFSTFENKLRRKMVWRTTISSIGMAQAISYKLNGHSTFENEDKSRFMEVKVPGWLDGQGNQYYLNVIGFQLKGLQFINQPTKTIMNKQGSVIRAMSKLVRDEPWDKKGGSRIQRALSGLILAPIIAQNMGHALMAEPEAYGNPKTLNQAVAQSALDYIGAPGTFSSESNRTGSARDAMEALADKLLDPSSDQHLGKRVEEWILSEQKSTQKELQRAKHKISGDIDSDANVEKISKMSKEEQASLLESYSSDTKKTVEDKLEYEDMKKKGKLGAYVKYLEEEDATKARKFTKWARYEKYEATDDEKAIASMGVKSGEQDEAVMEYLKEHGKGGFDRLLKLGVVSSQQLKEDKYLNTIAKMSPAKRKQALSAYSDTTQEGIETEVTYKKLKKNGQLTSYISAKQPHYQSFKKRVRYEKYKITSKEKKFASMGVKNGKRSKAIYKYIKSSKNPNATYKRLVDAKIISEEVNKQIDSLKKK